MDRQYVYKYCSPTRTAIQSGRNPYHVVSAASAPPLHPGGALIGSALILSL